MIIRYSIVFGGTSHCKIRVPGPRVFGIQIHGKRASQGGFRSHPPIEHTVRAARRFDCRQVVPRRPTFTSMAKSVLAEISYCRTGHDFVLHLSGGTCRAWIHGSLHRDYLVGQLR